MPKLGICAMALIGLTAAAPSGAAPSALSDLAAPGKLYSLGTHRLHLYCVGTGSPTVIFESGLGGTLLDWSRVQPRVGEFARACSYDRAGYGWSDPGPAPRRSARVAHELSRLLSIGEIAPPYVLVGHSVGGISMRLFARNHPEQVSGLVLVDATHERQFERFTRAGIRVPTAPRGRTFVISNHWEIPAGLPEHLRPTAQSLALLPDAVATLYDELGELRYNMGELQADAALPDVPVVVITRSPWRGAGATRAALIERLWFELQGELAASAPRGRLVQANTAGHYIHLDQPRIVVDAVRTIVNASRARVRDALVSAPD